MIYLTMHLTQFYLGSYGIGLNSPVSLGLSRPGLSRVHDGFHTVRNLEATRIK